MIQHIACDIKDKMLASGYITEHYEYAEIIPDGETTYPAQYIGGGRYKSLFNLDVNGHSYLRKGGKMQITPAAQKNNIKYMSCGGDDNVLVKLPLRIVATVPKEKLGDNAFSDDYLASEIIALLRADVVIPEINAIDIEYVVDSTDTDSQSVWRSEVTGVEHVMDFKYSYVAIEFTVNITINPACLIDACY